jgi:hypothetical protein
LRIFLSRIVYFLEPSNCNISEIQVVEHILCFLGDPVTVVRAENVNQLWRSLVQNLVRKGKLKKTRRTLGRLRTIESFNESSSIKEAKVHAFKVLVVLVFAP